MSEKARQRIDVWLWRARFAKTRAAATRFVAEGGVRLVHNGVARLIEKPSVEVAPGDAIVFAQRGALKTLRIEALAVRRGPPAEARALYREADTSSEDA